VYASPISAESGKNLQKVVKTTKSGEIRKKWLNPAKQWQFCVNKKVLNPFGDTLWQQKGKGFAKIRLV